MPVVLQNFAGSKTTAIIGTATVTIPVSNVTVFPALGVNDYFYAILISSTDINIKEIVKVTAINGSNLTVLRAQEGTTAQTFPVNSIIELRLTKQTLVEWVATTTNDSSYADNSTRPASTGWVRNAMASIASAFGFSGVAATNGYLKLPNYLGGFIFQWGNGSVTNNGYVDITYPIAFPTAVFNKLAIYASAGTTVSNMTMSAENSIVTGNTTARFTMMSRDGKKATGSFFWLAIGH